MPIQFYCPNCGEFLEVDDDLEGRQGECPACGALLTIPAVSAPVMNHSESGAVSDNPFESPKSLELPESEFMNPDTAVRSPFLVKEIIQIVLQFYRNHLLSISFVGLILLLVNFDTFFDLYGLQTAGDTAKNSSQTAELSGAEFAGKFLPQKNALLFYLLVFLKYYVMFWAIKKFTLLFKSSERDRISGGEIRPAGFQNDRDQNGEAPLESGENASKTCREKTDTNQDVPITNESDLRANNNTSPQNRKKGTLPGIREYLSLLGGNFIFSAIVFVLALIGSICLSPIMVLSQSANALLALPGILVVFFVIFFFCRLCFSLSFYPFFIFEQNEGIFPSLKSSWYFAANRPDVTRALSLFFFLLVGSGLFFFLILTLLGAVSDSFFSVDSSLIENLPFTVCNTLIYFVFLPFFFILFSVIYLKMTGRLIRK